MSARGFGGIVRTPAQVAGGGSGVGTLQQVTDLGNVTTNSATFGASTAPTTVLDLYGEGDMMKLTANAAKGNFILYKTGATELFRAGVYYNGADEYYAINSAATTVDCIAINSDNDNVGIGARATEATARLQIAGTTKGFLLPRLTTVQRNAIVAPATGLQVYNSTNNTLDYYNGTSWKSAITGSGTADYIAVFDAQNNLTGYNYFSIIPGLYPTIAVGVNGVNPVTIRLKTVVASDYCYIDASSNLTLYGSNTYKGVAFNDILVGGTQMARFYNSGGTILCDFTGRITTSTIATAGSNVGAYNIARTFPEAVTGANQHGYVDRSIFRYGAGALNAFYAEITAGTTNAAYTQDHIACFQSLLTKDGANTLNILYDFVALGTLLNGGTLGTRYGFYLFDANNAGGGSLTDQYGIYIPALSTATGKNIGIYSGSVVTVGTNAPDDSAILQADSTTQGFLPPRMTGAQAEAITAAEGLLIYSTDGSGGTITSKGWWGYDGATWNKLN